jgi:hypothetical protein
MKSIMEIQALVPNFQALYQHFYFNIQFPNQILISQSLESSFFCLLPFYQAIDFLNQT